MTDIKQSNPKDSVGTSKVTFSTLPVQVLAEWALAMHEGAMRYGRHNYRVSGVRASVYFDAALRHLFAFWEGQDLDPDSGVPHIVKAIACFGVLRDSQLQGNWVDDRPPRAADQDWIKKANERTKELLARIPEEKRVPAYTELQLANGSSIRVAGGNADENLRGASVAPEPVCPAPGHIVCWKLGDKVPCALHRCKTNGLPICNCPLVDHD